MFEDYEPHGLRIDSTWRRQKKMREHSSQTSETITYEATAQTNQAKEVQCQTESLLSLMKLNVSKSDGEVNSAELGKFLKKVERVVLKQVRINNATSEMFAALQCSKVGEFENTLTCEFELHEKSALEENVRSEFQLGVTSLSWSPSGATLAVAYGTNENMSWSEDRSYICLWNIDRPKLKFDTCDQKLEVESSVQTIQFHPEVIGFVAAGLFSGVVAVWDVGKDEVVYSDGAHNDPVTSLCWMEEGSNSRSMRLMSASTDGKLMIWKLKRNASLLKFDKEYIISSVNIPRSFGAKGRGSLGVTCFTPVQNLVSNMTSSQQSRLITAGAGVIAGLENGLVVKCSTELPEQNPITFVYEGHRGPVYALDWSPFHRNIFLTCSTDQSCRIYHSLEAQALREIRTSWDGTSGISLMSCGWSLTRPTVFYVAASCGKMQAHDFTTTQLLSEVEVSRNEDDVMLSEMSLNEARRDVVATATSCGRVQVWRMSEGLVNGSSSIQHQLNLINQLAKQALSTD